MTEKDEAVHRAGGDEHHGPLAVSPTWARRILGAFWAGCVVLVLLEFWIHRHNEHPWEEIPAFYAIYGFVGVAGLIFLSKELRKLVARSEDYYDGE